MSSVRRRSSKANMASAEQASTIHVICRFRPPKCQDSNAEDDFFTLIDSSSVEIFMEMYQKGRTFTFDKVCIFDFLQSYGR
jgi:hypothetical protein